MANKVEVDIKLLIAAIALIIVATVGSAFTTYLFFSGGDFSLGSSSTKDSQESEETEKRMDIGPTISIGDFTVNLTTNGSMRFIRTGVVLEVNERAVISEIERRLPQIRDRTISLLRSRSVEDLNNANNFEILRAEIITSINELLISGQIVSVYFIDLVIQ